jgi:membrane associated rhomboid family serine protease
MSTTRDFYRSAARGSIGGPARNVALRAQSQYQARMDATPASLLHRLLLAEPWAYLVWPTLAMMVGALLQFVLGQAATRLAVVPRTATGLPGILTAPFMHANAGHLAANLPPFLILGGLVLRLGARHFLMVSILLVAGGGLLVWMLARRGAHVGMSGVIFGFLGYLLALAYFTRSTRDLLVAAGVLLLYGGLLAGVRPARQGTSWESHLFGLVAGVAIAWLEHR